MTGLVAGAMPARMRHEEREVRCQCVDVAEHAPHGGGECAGMNEYERRAVAFDFICDADVVENVRDVLHGYLRSVM